MGGSCQLYREAEVTHGRVAMLASLGFLVGEKVNPLFSGAITGKSTARIEEICLKPLLAVNFDYSVLTIHNVLITPP